MLKYSVLGESNQNDDQFSHGQFSHCNILLCLIQYLTVMHQGISRIFGECLFQQRMPILSKASMYFVHTIMTISNTLISNNNFLFQGAQYFLHMLFYLSYRITYSTEIYGGVQLIHSKLIILFFQMFKFKFNIKRTLG